MNRIMVLLLSLHTTSEIFAIEFAIKYANPNKEIILPCHYNEKADQIRWYFKRNVKDVWSIIFDLRMNTYKGYEGIYNLKENYCNLKIFEATRDRAGSYYFEHGNGHMKKACRYKVVVGDLQCDSNMKENRILIGENDCPIKAEFFRRSCSFSYYGNFDDQINFIWMKKYSGNAIVKHKTLQHNISSSNELAKTLKIVTKEDLVQVSNDMDKIIFECSLEHTDIEPCQLPLISIQYVKNTSKEDPPMYSNNLNDKSCFIDKADSVECSYHWNIRNENVTFQTNGQHLSRKHLTIFGNYQCISTCRFISNEVCQLLGTSFRVYEYPDIVFATWKIILIVQFIAIIIIIIFGLGFYVIAKNRRSKKDCEGVLYKNNDIGNSCDVRYTETNFDYEAGRATSVGNECENINKVTDFKDLDSQSLLYVDADNKKQLLEEEFEFHEPDMKELSIQRDTTAVNREVWKNEMGRCLKEIQELYVSKLDSKGFKGEAFYSFKLKIDAYKKPLEREENRNNFKIVSCSMSERGKCGDASEYNSSRSRDTGSKMVAFSSSESVIGGRGRSSGFGGGASGSGMVGSISGGGLMVGVSGGASMESASESRIGIPMVGVEALEV